MEALLTGIQGKLESFGQNTFQGAMPKDSKLPYTTFDQQDAFPQSKDTSGDSTKVTLIRINFWDTDNVRASQELDKTRDFFLNNNILLDATTCVMDTNLSSEALFLDPELLENGKEVWHGVLDLLFLTGQ